MKTIQYFLLFAVCLASSANVWGQVTIGSDAEPHPGAILDLQSTDKGLLLPCVPLKSDASWFSLSFGSETDTVAVKTSAAGMIVYNTAETQSDEGIYLWNGNEWLAVGSICKAVTSATLTASKEIIHSGGSVTLAAQSTGSNTEKTYIWQVDWNSDSSGFIDLVSIPTTASSYQVDNITDEAVFRVIVNNCDGTPQSSNEILVKVIVCDDPDDPNCSGGTIIGGGN